jgi:hypothetical protein
MTDADAEQTALVDENFAAKIRDIQHLLDRTAKTFRVSECE